HARFSRDWSSDVCSSDLNHEGEVRKGLGLREVWFITSTDGGNTWSDAANITMQVHRPNQPAANPAYRFAEDWRSYANTPGRGMRSEERRGGQERGPGTGP